MTKVVVQVRGGLVVGLYSNDPDTKVLIVECGSEGADLDEIMDVQEIAEFKGEDKFVPIEAAGSGILDESVSLSSLMG